MGVRVSAASAIVGASAVATVFSGSAVASGRVDWAGGLVIADGVGVASRYAPTPAAARGTSRRVAEDKARERLAAMVGALPLAEGGTAAKKARDPSVKDRLARAVSAAVTIAAEPETDGAWRVTMGLPIEAVRVAIYGRRTLPQAGDSGPPVVVVSGVAGKPAVGWTVEGIGVATLWVADIPPWAKDAPRFQAKKAVRGAIDLRPPSGASDIVSETVRESTLVVIAARP